MKGEKRAKKDSQPKKELGTSQKSIPVDLQTNKESSEAQLVALASSGIKLLEKTDQPYLKLHLGFSLWGGHAVSVGKSNA